MQSYQYVYVNIVNIDAAILIYLGFDEGIPLLRTRGASDEIRYVTGFTCYL